MKALDIKNSRYNEHITNVFPLEVRRGRVKSRSYYSFQRATMVKKPTKIEKQQNLSKADML